jgi:hypothetical protein
VLASNEEILPMDVRASETHAAGPALNESSAPLADEPWDARELESAELRAYPMSERRAILRYRTYLGLRFQCRLDLVAVVQCWEAGACVGWRREKMHRDCSRQLQEIELHRQRLKTERAGEVDIETAAVDWVLNRAAAWREWWESQPDSSPAVSPQPLLAPERLPPRER